MYCMLNYKLVEYWRKENIIIHSFHNANVEYPIPLILISTHNTYLFVMITFHLPLLISIYIGNIVYTVLSFELTGWSGYWLVREYASYLVRAVHTRCHQWVTQWQQNQPQCAAENIRGVVNGRGLGVWWASSFQYGGDTVNILCQEMTNYISHHPNHLSWRVVTIMCIRISLDSFI